MLAAVPLLALAAGCISDLKGSDIQAVERKITVDGRERTYRVYAPEGVTRPMSLVFSFHGFLGTARMQENYTLFNPVAARERFIIVYPDGIDKRWSLQCRPAGAPVAPDGPPDDMAFVLAIIDDVSALYPVDRARVFATGMSNGGFFCYALAAERGAVFAGIAPVAGGLMTWSADRFAATNGLSLLAMQNSNDRLVPFDGGPLGHSRRVDPRLLTMLPTTNAVARFCQLNGCAAAPQLVDLPDTDPQDGTTTQITRYPPGPGGFKVELWVIRGGGHCWPGRPTYARGPLFRAYVGKPSRDFDGAEAIWAFFKSCPSQSAITR
jgi:polyhydroxybutyrate depolymerase